MSEYFPGVRLVRCQIRSVIGKSSRLRAFGGKGLKDADERLDFAIDELRKGICDLQDEQILVMKSQLSEKE